VRDLASVMDKQNKVRGGSGELARAWIKSASLATARCMMYVQEERTWLPWSCGLSGHVVVLTVDQPVMQRASDGCHGSPNSPVTGIMYCTHVLVGLFVSQAYSGVMGYKYYIRPKIFIV
jgi:hypothetical protein